MTAYADTGYADSAIDYTWEILRIDVAQRLMQVKYSTADSARPDILLNLEPRSDQYNESDLSIVAMDASKAAVIEWDKVIQATTENPSFDPSTLEGNTYNARYKPFRYEVQPEYNSLTSKTVEYDSEGPDDICRKYNIVTLNDSDKATVRASISISPSKMWTGLFQEGRLDSGVDLIGLSGTDFGQYDEDNIEMLLGMLQFEDSATQKLQSMFAYNDSDWASWLVSRGGNNRSMEELSY